MQNFLEGKKTYISAFILTIMAILPDIQALMVIEGDLTTFNFWFPLAKIAVGASTAFFKHLGVKREVNKAIEATKAEAMVETENL